MYISIIFLPFINFIINGTLGRLIGKKGGMLLTFFFMFLTIFLSFFIFFEIMLCHSISDLELFIWVISNIFIVD